ncbi:MAG: hypothetical protein II114_01305 [Treponema sp.]|nr:hypothetical protein [Treponema sp.]
MMTTLTSKSLRAVPRFLIVLSLLFLWGGVVYASDWVLAAAPFSFPQAGPKDSYQKQAAEFLPKMILEQIGTDDMRLPPRSEMLDRKLDSLRTDRQSLFLQLSAAIKTRDSLFLQESNEKKLQKKLKDQEKKIKEIQDKIDRNLKDAELAEAQIESESEAKPQEKSSFLQSFASLFAPKETKLVPDSVNEQVKIYNNDSSSLLSPDAEIWKTGMQSRDFISFMSKQNVNGYLTGSITFYGNYFSATVELWIYPGGKQAGSVIEVGSIDNLVGVARNITQYLRTVIVNSSPVKLYFDITPEDAAKNARIMVDGLVPNLSGNTLSVTAGLHTISVESKGYETLVTTYSFKNSPDFFVHIPMSPESKGQFSLYLKNPAEGDMFSYGKNVGDGIHGASITINGTPVVGMIQRSVPGVEGVDEEGNIITEPGKPLGAFYYVPVKLQEDGASLVVNADLLDTEALIDARRKWAYRGYTALVITLPLTFIAAGNYNTAVSSYRAGYVDRATVEGWGYARIGTIVLTSAAAGFFIYELVRYLHAASSVLPKTAVKASEKDMEKIRSAIETYDAQIEDKKTSEDNSDEKDNKIEKTAGKEE